MLIERELDLTALLQKKSIFLFGPRGVGKTSLVRTQLKGRAVIIDLLRSSLFTRLAANPDELESMIEASLPQLPKGSPWIVIDEIQKLPELLDVVHHLIEERHWRFLLTGSSARKLKRGGANLLAGRAWKAELFPLTSNELEITDLDRCLRYGTLPAVWFSEDPAEELDAYVGTYLKEEIREEGLIRKLAPFARFLKVAALSAGQLINYAEIASDAAVAESTVRQHLSVLEDTLLGFVLEPFTETKKRKAIQTGKFYIFDTGVMHQLRGTESLDRNSDTYGVSFESFIASELRAYLSYRRAKLPFCFWRSTHQHEVDFLVGTRLAIEVKSTTRTTSRHFAGLKALAEEGIFKDFFLVSQDPVERLVKLDPSHQVRVMHWKRFLKELWDGRVLT
jgi:predicted AAA+ superfamily ATPase